MLTPAQRNHTIMLTPAHHNIVSPSPHRGRALALCALALLLAACGATRPGTGAALPPGYLYKAELAFVRIEPIEPGAPDNAHPATVPTPGLRRTLEAMHAAGTISISAKPVFTAEELDAIVAPLAAALAKAGPREDVVFASRGLHGLFGKYSPATVTTGRVFVHDGRVNMIFGWLHDQFDQMVRGEDAVHSLVPGSRAKRLASGWDITSGGIVPNRSDWVAFEVPAAVEASPPRSAETAAPKTPSDAAAPAPAPAAPDDARYQELERKLKLLDRMKANGLITDEEYRDQRRTILQGM